MAPQKYQLGDHEQASPTTRHKPNSLLQDYLVQQQRQANLKMQQQQQPMKIKMLNNDSQSRSFADQLHHNHQTSRSLNDSSLAASSSIGQVQRKLLAFFYCYAILVVTMFLAYAIFCYHQQSAAKHSSRHSSADQLQANQVIASSQVVAASGGDDALQPAESQQQQQSTIGSLETKLESKILLLERYIEVIALDLEETKTRLKEREKCGCSIGCTFNGTKFNDNQIWQQKCDTCTCRAGKISCMPKKCPQLNCDDQVQLPGQCCPVCMKKCKLPNKTLVRHGQTFSPTDSNGTQVKQCICHNGLVKCEKIQQQPNKRAIQPQISQQQQQTSNKTVSEYLKLISTANHQNKVDLNEPPPPSKRKAAAAAETTGSSSPN